jgi:hypothetical protein
LLTFPRRRTPTPVKKPAWPIYFDRYTETLFEFEAQEVRSC